MGLLEFFSLNHILFNNKILTRNFINPVSLDLLVYKKYYFYPKIIIKIVLFILGLNPLNKILEIIIWDDNYCWYIKITPSIPKYVV